MRAVRILAALIASCAALPAAPAFTAEPVELGALLTRVQARYSAARTARLDFVERYVSQATTRSLEEKGTLWLSTPGRMRWEYRDPEEKLFLVDGELTWFYVPEDKVAYRMRTRATEARRLPALFLAGKGELARDYQARLERAAATTTLRLVPRQGGEEYEHLLLEVEPDSGTIRSLKVIDALGNLTAFEFSAEQSPVTLPERAFEFEAPRGVEVVETQSPDAPEK